MSIARVGRRSVRVIGAVATVSAVLPLGLMGCARAADVTSHAAELHASADSNLLASPAERVYEVTDTSLISPAADSGLGAMLTEQVASTGYMVLTEGVITQAQFNVQIAELPAVSFELTQPAVLRRGGSDGTVSAVGTLAFDGKQRPNTSVELTPTTIGDEVAEFDVRFSVPESRLAVGSILPFDEVAAHLVLSPATGPRVEATQPE
ncbi:hypothetical protein [Leucobacter luti]|uniref:hypothetical protein n=1 Tax=Leucobacter luti TaxID=340320 RepID=UPI003D010F76